MRIIEAASGPSPGCPALRLPRLDGSFGSNGVIVSVGSICATGSPMGLKVSRRNSMGLSCIRAELTPRLRAIAAEMMSRDKNLQNMDRSPGTERTLSRLKLQPRRAYKGCFGLATVYTKPDESKRDDINYR